FDATWPELESHVTVWVSPEDDIEFRQVELRNLGDRPLTLELMSAFEVTLADPAADEAHPAFSNMFVRARWQASQQAVLFERKPRLPTEPHLHAALFLAHGDDEHVSAWRVQTQRLQWSGRNHGTSHPLAQFPREIVGEDRELDTALDPVCALSGQVRLEAHGTMRLVYALAASDKPETLAAVIDKYRHPMPIERSSKMSATLTGIRLRELNLSAESYAAIQDLTTAITSTLARPNAVADAPAKTAAARCDRRALWRFGISGHRPIVLVTASASHSIGLLRTLG
ncbi:MAG: carbohydrate-binding protein, partial [Rhizobacter sp.]